VFNGRHAGIGADIKLTAGARSFERGRYPEHELWEAVEGYLDLLDAPESPPDLPVAGGKMDLPPR
jgi:hypothetical protein